MFESVVVTGECTRERKALEEKLNVISFNAVSYIFKTAAFIRINGNKPHLNALEFKYTLT